MAKKTRDQGLDYRALTKELNTKGPGRLYLLWGPEDYLIADFTEKLCNACISEGMEEFDHKRLDGPALDPDALAEALDAMPFFGGRTFVELRGVDVNKCRDAKTAELLSDIPDWCTVVITLPTGAEPDGRLSLVKQLKKDGKAVEFTSQKGELLYNWITRRFQAHGKRIDKAVMDRLITVSGELMNQLIPEIEKISAYAPGEQITAADVDRLAHHLPEAIAFDMTNCIADRDFDGAAEKMTELLAGDAEPIEVMGTIGWQLRRLYAAKVILEHGGGAEQIREMLGIYNDYAFRQTMETVKRFSLSELARDVRHVAEYSMKFREQGGVITETEALKELLILIAMENRRAVP